MASESHTQSVSLPSRNYGSACRFQVAKVKMKPSNQIFKPKHIYSCPISYHNAAFVFISFCMTWKIMHEIPREISQSV